MKIRLDYQTNSSSASFICYISSNTTDVQLFKQDLKRLMDKFIQNEVPFLDGYHTDGSDPETIARYQLRLDQMLENTDPVTSNTYVLRDWTSMLNSLIEDTPKFLQYLLLESMMVGLQDFGIQSVQLRLDDAGGHYNR